MAVLTLLVGLPMLGVYIARDLSPWVVLLQVPMYVAFGLQAPLIATFLNRRVDAPRRATVLALAAFASVIAVLVAEPSIGWLSTATDIYAVGLALGLVTLVFGAAIVARWRAVHPAFVPELGPAGASLWTRLADRFARFRP